MKNKNLFTALIAGFIGMTGGILTTTSYVIISAISAAEQGSTLLTLTSGNEGEELRGLHGAAPENAARMAQYPMLILILLSFMIAVCAFVMMKNKKKTRLSEQRTSSSTQSRVQSQRVRRGDTQC